MANTLNNVYICDNGTSSIKFGHSLEEIPHIFPSVTMKSKKVFRVLSLPPILFVFSFLSCYSNLEE